MESFSQGGRSVVLKSLEGGVFSPNPDAPEASKYISATVPYLEYYYPMYCHDPRFNWDKQILGEQDPALPRDPDRSHGR
jgi:hypothetical protein